MAGKYVNGSGLVHLWTKMKDTFLLISEEMVNPSISNRKFATFCENNTYDCGNTDMIPSPATRKIIPLQVSPDFDGSTGCYVYQSYISSSKRCHRTTYQLNSSKQLYTIPASGSPGLVTSITVNGSTITNSGGFFVVQDSMYGNWWLSNTSATIDRDAFGFPSGDTTIEPEEPPVVVIPDTYRIHITNSTLDTTQLNDLILDWWNSSDAEVYIRYSSAYDWEIFSFATAVTSTGGTRVCYPVPGGTKIWTYTITRTNSSPYYSISISGEHITPSNPN